MNFPSFSPPLDYAIREVVQGIFENMLNLRLNAECDHMEGGGERLTAKLNFTGTWAGYVSLSCEVDQARRLAARFLELPLDELGEQLVVDVMGEIVNMIAGNLKSVFASDIRLALAEVARGTSELDVFEPANSHDTCFESAEGFFRVTVVAVIAPPKPRPHPSQLFID